MASRYLTREISIVDKEGRFSALFKKRDNKEKTYDFDSLSDLRKLLSNEKARMLHVIKSHKPDSIYKLAKILKRDFKAVSNDIKLLEMFGFIDLISEKSGNRERLKPVIAVDTIYINLKIN